jgi:hypothetical protein
MAHPHHTLSLALLEKALTVLFCRIDDAYYLALVTSEVSARRFGVRQQVEICFSSLKRYTSKSGNLRFTKLLNKDSSERSDRLAHA